MRDFLQLRLNGLEQHPELCSIRMSAQLWGRLSTQFCSWVKRWLRTTKPRTCRRSERRETQTASSPLKKPVSNRHRSRSLTHPRTSYTNLKWGLFGGTSHHFSGGWISLVVRQELWNICRIPRGGRPDDESQKTLQERCFCHQHTHF